MITMQMPFLSPPFGYALFYIRGVCPPHIQMSTIFKASFVFLAMQVVGPAGEVPEGQTRYRYRF